MRKTLTALILWLTLAACAVPTSVPATTAAPTAVPAKTGTLRISYPTSLGIADVPLLMALDSLKAEGYTVETVQLARFDLNITALANGELDIASGGNLSAWAAIAEGGKFRTILARLNNPDYLVAKAEVADCQSLANRNVGLSGTNTFAAALLDQYIEQNCPGTTPQVVVIANSTNRKAALLAGEIDATNVQLDDWLELNQEAPDQYHALVRYAEQFPQVQSLGFHVNSAFAQAHPELVKDFIRAMLAAQRAIQDKAALKAAAQKYVEMDEATAETQATAYLDHKVWDVNGGLTTDNLQITLDLVQKAGFLSTDLKTTDVADLSYLNAVLAEIGRQ